MVLGGHQADLQHGLINWLFNAKMRMLKHFKDKFFKL